jgi:Na+:H+ antiporter, NhaA family
MGAIGGMVALAAIHLFLNHGTATQSGFGIPMATDIAFSLGALSLLTGGLSRTLPLDGTWL